MLRLGLVLELGLDFHKGKARNITYSIPSHSV